MAAETVPVHRALAEAFVAEGTDVVFALMGDGNKHWLVDLAACSGVRLVHVRHEGAALAMADGFARARGGDAVGVCAVTYGPGVSQLSTSLLVAAKHRTPLVVFAADLPDGMRDSGAQLDVDERALLEAAGAAVREVRAPTAARGDVHLAFHQARTERRPVALLVGVDVQERLVPVDRPGRADGPRSPLPVPHYALAPDPRAVTDAASVLLGCRRPLVLAGRGVTGPGGRVAVARLAERLGAPVATTFLAKGFLDDHPSAVGIAGGFALERTRRVLQQADAVVALGASLNEHTTDHGRLFAQATVVQVDTAVHALVRGRASAACYVRGDAILAAHSIVDELDRCDGPCSPFGHDAASDAADQRTAELVADPVVVAPGTVDPRMLMLALDDVLPDDAHVVVGGGHFMAFPARFLSGGRERTFEMAFDFMTTGQAVPHAIGAAVAQPGRLVVAVEGDASILMHIQELETATRAGVALVVLVLNDGALGAEYHRLRSDGLDAAEAIVPGPDLAHLAEAFGGRGRRVGHVDELGDLLSWYDPARGPHLVDCQVSRAVVGPI